MLYERRYVIMKRVLHVIPGYGGGIASFVGNLVAGINKEKLEMDVCGFNEYPYDYIQKFSEKNGKTYTLDNIRAGNIIKASRTYYNLVKNGKYDAVHIHFTDYRALYFSFFSRLAGTHRVIVHAHIANSENKNQILENIKQMFCRKITLLSATQLASCSKIASNFRFGCSKVEHNQVMHIPNSVNKEKYDYDIDNDKKYLLRRELGIDDDEIVIGHVGYFGYQKNHAFMLDIINALKKKNIKFKWIFIGDGEYFEKIKESAQEKSISDKILFLGRRDDVNTLFQIMDVSVLPSHFEGLPTVAIESQAAGTPIVVANTVSDEIEMNLNLVYWKSLKDNIDEWCNSILNAANQKKNNFCDAKKRFKKIDKLNFSSERVGELYFKFINNEISYYNLGDEI